MIVLQLSRLNSDSLDFNESIVAPEKDLTAVDLLRSVTFIFFSSELPAMSVDCLIIFVFLISVNSLSRLSFVKSTMSSSC